MKRSLSRRELARRSAMLGVALCLPALPRALAVPRNVVRPTLAAPRRSAADEGYHPTAANRPVGPGGASPEQASFIDPTAEITGAEQITIFPHVYIGPFARLLADADHAIIVEEGSNVQDNVTIYAKFSRGSADEARVKALGLAEEVEIGARVIMAHGCTVKGPAQIGVQGGNIPADADEDGETFLSFACEIDGAILEKNTGVSALARVGPGVRLRSGFLVLPGKNVTTQREADDPALGKVREVNEDDVAFNEAVLEVNEVFAREYARLYYEDASSVLGINVNPGGGPFNPVRQLPITSEGVRLRAPDFRNRLIGGIYLNDSFERLNRVMGNRISIRADEGDPFSIGRIRAMGDNVIFHALEESDVYCGNGVAYGERAIVHGGGRRIITGNEEDPTFIANDVTLARQAVVFRSIVGEGATIGVKSAIVNSNLVAGAVIPDRVVYLNDAIFGEVEW